METPVVISGTAWIVIMGLVSALGIICAYFNKLMQAKDALIHEKDQEILRLNQVIGKINQNQIDFMRELLKEERE